jgi:hypothetical protein
MFGTYDIEDGFEQARHGLRDVAAQVEFETKI